MISEEGFAWNKYLDAQIKNVPSEISAPQLLLEIDHSRQPRWKVTFFLPGTLKSELHFYFLFWKCVLCFLSFFLFLWNFYWSIVDFDCEHIKYHWTVHCEKEISKYRWIFAGEERQNSPWLETINFYFYNTFIRVSWFTMLL